MPGRAWAVAAVLLVGCRGPHFYDPPPEQVAPAANRGGTEIVVVDERPEWEKKPFTGAACLFHPSKVRPSPWEQIATEAEKVAAEMPVKPTRVTVTVKSLRLVRLDHSRVEDELRQVEWQSLPGIRWSLPLEAPQDLYPAAVLEHPDGASCAIEATVWAEGVPKKYSHAAVRVIAGGPGNSGTAYTGDVMEFPVKAAVFQFGRQFRSAVGLPPDG